MPHAGSCLSDADLARLSGWPDEIADDDLITFFTLTDSDLDWLSSNYRLENRLGAATQRTTASLLIAKLHASSRQNSLARALKEYGWLVLTICLCRYVASEELRRRVRRHLNKGESLHALRRDLFFAHQGHVRRPHLDDQVDQALCLTPVTNAAVLWTTTYLGYALDALRAGGHPVTDEAAAQLTPAQHDHINFYGTYSLRRRNRTASPGTPTAPVTGCLTNPRHRRDEIRSAAKGTPAWADVSARPSAPALSAPASRYRSTPQAQPPVPTAPLALVPALASPATSPLVSA